MAKFHYTLSEDDKDLVCIRVDDIFDINILRIEEGLVIDVYENDEHEGTLDIRQNSIARNREDRT